MMISRMMTLLVLAVLTLSIESQANSSFGTNNQYYQSGSHKTGCSSFLTRWLPGHPNACPAETRTIHIAEGIAADITAPTFNWHTWKFESSALIRNTSHRPIPKDSKLLLSIPYWKLMNRDGVAEDGRPFVFVSERVEAGGSLSFALQFPILPRKPRFDFDIALVFPENNNGVIAIGGFAMEGETLTATIDDPEGIFDGFGVIYQWWLDWEMIEGATEASYTLTEAEVGGRVTVSALYVDNDFFIEKVISEASSEVLPKPEDQAGSVAIDGSRVLGSQLIAVVNDGNGISNPIDFQWFLDDTPISGATSDTLALSAEYLGQRLSVKAWYQDDDGYDSALISDKTSYVVSRIVSGQAELAQAVLESSAGDWLGLADGDYLNMPELNIETPITLTLSQDSQAVIEGVTCWVLKADKASLVGLTFAQLDMQVDSTCDANGDSAIYLSGDGHTIRENQFLGEVATPSNNPFNWIAVRGSFSLLARNLFTGKNMALKGAAISIYNNTSTADQYGHVIEYNWFKDFPNLSDGSGESSAYALQIGRSTGTSANGLGTHVLRYNRFENIKSKQRLVKVQSSHNFIYSNTIVDSIGNISLENGERNTVANNIILPTGEDADSNDGGISFTPYGHVIKNNYLAGLRTTSSQRGALVTNHERFNDASNQALSPLPVTVTNNTIINSRQAINLSSNGCEPEIFTVNFSANLIANGEDPTPDQEGDYGFEGKTNNGVGRSAVIDNCALNTASTFDNEHYYSASLSANGSFFLNSENGNITGGEGAADIVAGANGLFEGANNDNGIGADTGQLVYLSAAEVGPGSTYTAPPAQTTYDQAIGFDLSQWNITFPDGEVEDDPSWLLEGNTRADAFFYGDDGEMVFRCPNIGGTTDNSTFSRSELREMLRGPEPDPKPSGWPKTRGYTKNNWIFSTAPQSTQFLMGGVDGRMDATLRIDQVSTTGDSSIVGRVVVGQIHASVDEPIRLYYRKLPNNALGSVYFRHEVPNIGDLNFDLIGSSSSSAANPVDGIALGEIWSYRIETFGPQLKVTIMRAGKPDVVREMTMDPAYYEDWVYFKAGVYNQNNTGTEDDFVQATFFALTKSHDPAPDEPGDDPDPVDPEPGDGDITNGDELKTALANAEAGDVLELSNGDYSNLGTVAIGVDDLIITVADDSSPVISGELCLVIAGDRITLTGLTFSQIAQVDLSPCIDNGDAAIVLSGDQIEFSRNTLDGDRLTPVAEGQDTFNWLAVRGSNIVVERNLFQNKRGLAIDGSLQLRGAYISVFITGSGTDNIIQYNHFRDMLLNDQSLAYAIQLGRTSGADSTEIGFNQVRYNLFDNIDSKTRVIRVQGSQNLIENNTVINSQGAIALEDGWGNLVASNIILPSGEDGNDAGISFAPYGHFIANNYLAGFRTTSSERAALYFNANANGSGNSSLTPSAVTINNNTILNANQLVHWGNKGCGNGPSIEVQSSQNFIANGVLPAAEGDLTGQTVTGVPLIRDDCPIDLAASAFVDEAYYAASLSTSDSLVLPGVTLLPEESAPIAFSDLGFVLFDDPDSTAGVDVELLFMLTPEDVGPESTESF